jgi:hypothetical protein
LFDDNDKTAVTIREPSRCQVCNTILTLYPVDYTVCPKCGRAVCRQCWGDAWYAKDFSAETCRHVEKAVGPTVSPMAQKIKGPGMDWPKTVITTIAAIAIIALLIFLWDLLAF